MLRNALKIRFHEHHSYLPWPSNLLTEVISPFMKALFVWLWNIRALFWLSFIWNTFLVVLPLIEEHVVIVPSVLRIGSHAFWKPQEVAEWSSDVASHLKLASMGTGCWDLFVGAIKKHYKPKIQSINHFTLISRIGLQELYDTSIIKTCLRYKYCDNEHYWAC